MNLALQDTVKGLKDLSEAVKVDASNSEVLNSRAQLYYELNDFSSSDADYRSMIALDEGDVMGYMGIGRNASAENRWDDAIANFNHVIKLAPDYPSGYSFRAESYIGQKKWNEATDDIVKALEINGDSKAFGLLHNLPEEATDLLKSKFKIQMAKQPTNFYWPYCMAVLFNNAGNFDEAISYYEKVNSIDASSTVLGYISKCYLAKQEYDKALDYIDRALAINPEDYDAVAIKANILGTIGRYDESFIEHDRYVRRYPADPVAYINRANDLLGINRFEDAIEDLNTAVVLNPSLSDNLYLLIHRGDAYRCSGNEAAARKDYLHIIELEKDSAVTGASWTPYAYTGLGDREKAIESMQLVLKNDTTDVSGNLYDAACVYARLGENEEALKYLSEAIEKGYNNWAFMATDSDLVNLRDFPEYKQLLDSISSGQTVPAPEDGVVIDEEGVIEKAEVPFTKEGGVTKVRCTINGLPLHFVFDTGAADVTMSMVEANFMLKNDYIKPMDIIGAARYVDANGEITEGTVINLRKVNFGGLELDNVRASVVRNQKAPLLLGQSVLGRLGKIEIDNPGMRLLISHKK